MRGAVVVATVVALSASSAGAQSALPLPNDQRAMYCLGYLAAVEKQGFPGGCPTLDQLRSLKMSPQLTQSTLKECTDIETALRRLRAYFAIHAPTVSFTSMAPLVMQQGQADEVVCNNWAASLPKLCQDSKTYTKCVSETHPEACRAAKTCITYDGLPW